MTTKHTVKKSKVIICHNCTFYNINADGHTNYIYASKNQMESLDPMCQGKYKNGALQMFFVDASVSGKMTKEHLKTFFYVSFESTFVNKAISAL